MLNILIPTKPDDTHSILVHLALKKKGHQSFLWQTADFPVQQTHSFRLIDQEICWNAHGANLKIEDGKFDVVWFRRPAKPSLSDLIHSDDLEIAKKECGKLFESFWEIIAPDAMWVNPPSKARAANSKLLQLKIAAKVGLKIPKTIVSNNPEEIKKFFEQDSIGTIYKTLYPMGWTQGKDIRMAYTKEVKINELPDLALKMTPGIFQEKIPKAYELRVTYFGKCPIAVKLYSQEHPKGAMDWRYIPIQQLAVEEYNLPEVVNKKCQEFMSQLGIVFGCFDFIVTPNNEYYFLEVNESGQFLWIEDIKPEIKMLDIFTEFLISKNPNFQGTKEQNPLSSYDFSEEAKLLLKEFSEQHVETE